jgi:hypothetical protein
MRGEKCVAFGPMNLQVAGLDVIQLHVSDEATGGRCEADAFAVAETAPAGVIGGDKDVVAGGIGKGIGFVLPRT